jgi:hypothetical protein
MSCCGKGRAAVAGMYGGAGATGAARPASAGRRGPGTTRLRYVGTRPARVRGTATGRTYDVRAGDELTADTRDVAALLRTGLFSRG